MVECALEADGITSPASVMLDQLKAGALAPDPDRGPDDPWPDEEQPHDYFQFLSSIKHFADNGTPLRGGVVNDLDDGIWEFKRGSKRISFYDTDGAGSFLPKLRILDIKDAQDSTEQYWWFPYFEDTIRLGHSFVKEGNLAGPKNIRETKRIRTEDLAHDKSANDAPELSS